MKVVFANDTSNTSNPGCKGTVAGLLNCLKMGEHEVISRVPIGYGCREYAKCLRSQQSNTAFPGQKRIVAAMRVMATGSTATRALAGSRFPCQTTWDKSVKASLPGLRTLWSDADALVLNGEGTVHDNSVGALSLLGLCAAAKRLEKCVALVNASIFGLDEWLLEVIRDSVDFLSVREPISRNYLLQHGIQSQLSADCLFLSSEVDMTSASWIIDGVSPFIVYTPGVLSGKSQVNAEAISRDIRSLLSEGVLVHYLVVEEEDEGFARVAAECGARVIPLGGVPWNQVSSYLRRARCVVSGRYHINIFAMIGGVPFLPMETNTPKMKGLLELLGKEGSVNIRSWCDEEPLDIRAAIRVPEAAVERCRALAASVLRGF